MKFTLNKPFATDQSGVDVDAGLPPGAYRFQLVVVNQDGRSSAPAVVTVTIQPRIVVPPVVVDPRLVTPVVTPTPLVSPRTTPVRTPRSTGRTTPPTPP